MALFLQTAQFVVDWLLRPAAPPADVRAAYDAAHVSRSCASTLGDQLVEQVRRANSNYVAHLMPSLRATLGTADNDESPLGPGAATPRDLAAQMEGVTFISYLTDWFTGTGSLAQARALWDCEPRPSALAPVRMGALAGLLYYECFRLGEVRPALVCGLLKSLKAYRTLVADHNNPPTAFSSLPVGLILLAHVMYFPTLGPHAVSIRVWVCDCISPQRDWYNDILSLPVADRGAFRRNGVDFTPCPYEAWGCNSPLAQPGGRPLRGYDACSGCLKYLEQARRRGKLNVLDIQIAAEYANVLVQPLRWAGPGGLAPRQ